MIRPPFPSRPLLPRAAAAAALAALLAVTGCSGPKAGHGGGSGAGPSATADGAGGPGAPGSALRALDSVAVKGAGTSDGYARDRFGSAWADTDGNGCGTRDDILKRDLRGTAFRDAKKCVVVSGTLPKDPYTGKALDYRRGRSTVDIDHVVALSDAWRTGARQWAGRKRVALANDPLNLIAVDASANRRKRDGDAADWLPPYTGYRCTYVARQVAVKKKYGLWVTREEKAAMAKVLNSCPRQALPGGGTPTQAPERFAAK
ncbi:HNH endonuclease family protein [Streptomyces sp. RS10V-4]|uniref:HNH endonuclease family protein n=1 Tax=Streptomyces rhizoryzae TaxID=2932493 RepID=UPI00200439A7|nr:HNH endonuclease family protein [Streptomyces rhizoryzae]MCK7625101.1 HNH endonuclease family protein [Streptomyces rhizoryzae]